MKKRPSTPRRRAGQASLATPKVRRAFPTREDATAGCLPAGCVVGIYPAMRGLRINKIESHMMDALRYATDTINPKSIFTEAIAKAYGGNIKFNHTPAVIENYSTNFITNHNPYRKAQNMRLPHPPKPFFNTEALKAIAEQRMELAIRKNHDYSGTMDAIAIAGVEGIATRLLDKSARLHSLVQPGMEAKVTDESIRDTLMDMANYAEYGVSLLDGTWGKMPPPRPVVAYVPTLEEQVMHQLRRTVHKLDKTTVLAIGRNGGIRYFTVGQEMPMFYSSKSKSRIMRDIKVVETIAKTWAVL